MTKLSIFWFRRDLRLEDNVGLYHALKDSNPVLPLFIFDKNILSNLPKEDARVEFIHESLLSMNEELIQKKSSLLVKYGTPEKIFKSLLVEFSISKVYTNHDYEPYAIERDEKIKKILSSNKVEFLTFKDQVIFEKNEILSQTGTPYKVYTPYKNKWRECLQEKDLKSYPSERDANFYTTSPFKIPDLKELGFKVSGIPLPSGKISESKLINYGETRDYPYLDSTSRIGIRLRFGTVSIRKVVKKAIKLNETWLNELIWREFFMQLLFHFPYVVNEPFNSRFKNMPWRYDEVDFKKWCEGKTGYPLVDAGMRELKQTGFMHNRVRMVTASFLSKHLLIDWRMGERYFAEKLLDYELSSNNGNWQWSAGTGADAQPFFRIFNPELQQKKFDPEFKYIKKWVPEFGTSSYPAPMIDHKKAVDRAKKAFNVIS